MLHRQKILPFITDLGNQIFNITWIKKDGSVRNANVRRHVTKYLNGGKGPGKNSSFIAVYLMPKMTGNTFLYEKDYRMVNLETVKEIHANGKRHYVTPKPVTSSTPTAKSQKTSASK